MKRSKFNLLNMKIVTRIFAGSIIILILSISAIGFLIYELRHTGRILDELYNTFIVANNSLEAEINIHVIDNLTGGIPSALVERDEDLINLLLERIKELDDPVGKHLSTAENRVRDEKGKELIAEVKKLLKKWDITKGKLALQIEKKNFSAASSLTSEAKGNVGELVSKLTELNFQTGEVANKFHAEAIASIGNVIIASIIISLILLSIAILISLLLSRSIAKSLSFFKEIFSRGASGDLEARYPVIAKSRDEINDLGSLFNQFMDKMLSVIKEVIDTSNELGVSSEELSTTTASFSDNSQSQAASSEEITATMEEISAGIDSVSENAQYQFDKLNDLIHQMKELSGIINEMAERVTEAQGSSKDISSQAKSGDESLQLMNRSMSKITESSDKVTDIIGIINDISDRINLLSLNAAIEAARAGEAGRGFAVVADEISKLAEQTATSISDIDSLIRANNDEIKNGMKNVLDTIESISLIIEGVESITDMMNQIFENMKKQQATNESVNRSADELKERSDEVKNATREQKNAVREVMKSITTINELNQSSAAGAEEITGSTSKLASMADNLKERVGFFKV